MSYTPPKVWTWDEDSAGQFARINRPVAGSTHERELPVGEHPLQHDGHDSEHGGPVLHDGRDGGCRGEAGREDDGGAEHKAPHFLALGQFY